MTPNEKTVEDGEATPEKPERPRVRVLVVDDEPDARTILERALTSLSGYEVTTAKNAKDALRAISEENEPFDGVFLDVQMPEMTGVELCPLIRGTPGYSDVPIIMLTALTNRDMLREAFSAGANDYITKPYDFAEIRRDFAREGLTRRRRKHLKDLSKANSPTSSGEVIRALEDAVTIAGVRRCVSRDAFHTYAMRSSARYNEPLHIRAIKIARVYDHFTRLPVGQYQAMIHSLAAMVSELGAKSGDVFTYYGNGIFLVSNLGTSSLTDEALAKALEESDAFNHLANHGLTLNVILGGEVPLLGRRQSDVIEAFDGAIEAAERVENSHFGWATFREWLSFRRSVGQEKSRIHRSTYEQLLNDFIEEGELDWKRL